MRLKSSDVQIFIALVTIGVVCAYPQFPPRLHIPGALPIDGRPAPPPQPIQRARARAPPASIPYAPIQEVRPVIEDPDDDPIPSAIRFVAPPQHNPQPQQQQQHLIEVEPERPTSAQRQIPFQQPQQLRPQYKQPANYPPQSDLPHLRRPAQQPQAARPAAPAPRPAARPAPQYLDDEGHRTRKPPVQILRKYRTDNADGSITWGYENEDGSFKEETIGIDCITRGKYGYVDPDGVKREYSYETGGTCEEPEEDLDDLPPQQQQAQKGKKPYKPNLPQYIN